MRLWTIVNSQQAISELTKMKINKFKAFNLSVFLKKVEPEISTYYEIRSEKMKELEMTSKPIPWTNLVNIFCDNAENMKAYNEFMKELDDKEIDIEAPKISLADIWETTMSAETFLNLDWLFVENEN